MTINQVLQHIDEYHPNTVSLSLKLRWINEAEGYIQREVFLDRCLRVQHSEENLNAVLLAPMPYDRLYIEYLDAQLFNLYHETADYENSAERFNETIRDYAGWYARNYHPARAKGRWRRVDSYYPYPYDGGGGGGGGGADGVGISDISFTRVDAEGGNVYTIRLTNGATYEFTAPKGAKGDKGDKGNKGDPGSGEGGLSSAIKQALMLLANNVAYRDGDGTEYSQALYDALYPDEAELESISAVFTQGAAVIYDIDSLASLKLYLTVQAQYSDGTSEILDDSDYSLSGTLTAGTSTITVSYGGMTDTFTVAVTAAPTLASISAAYTQSGTVYPTDSLDSLKSDLIVTATYTDSTTAVIAAANYTLSGTLTAGSSTITVSYGGQTDTFTVTVSAAPTLTGISAVFTQGQAVIYDTDSLNDLKQYLAVTAHYSDSSSAVVSDYSLSGSLVAGTSTITVTYSGQTDTFTVTVTAHEVPSNVYDLTFTNGKQVNNSGEVTNSASYKSTVDMFDLDMWQDKISVVYTKAATDYGPYFAAYQSDGTFISRPNATKSTSGSTVTAVFNIPGLASKGRICMYIDATDITVYKGEPS